MHTQYSTTISLSHTYTVTLSLVSSASLSRAVDEGDTVDTLYPGFADAFDKVPRKRLTKRLVYRHERSTSTLDRELAYW
jgi:hypothetical protein